MNGKISGKQEVVGGFDLETFVGDVEDTPHTKPKSPMVKKPPLPKKEALTERVQIKVTKEEMETLRQKIGLVPVSKWLRHELKLRKII